jgi:hypothetical protein
MVTPDLLHYILVQQKKNISKENIISNLRAVGWHEDDIAQAFERVEVATPTVAPVPLTPVRPVVSQPIEINAAPAVITSQPKPQPESQPKPQATVVEPRREETEELFPKLIPKTPPVEPRPQPVIPESFIPRTPVAPVTLTKPNPSPMPTGVVSGAIISTFPKDVITVRETKSITPTSPVYSNTTVSGAQKGGKGVKIALASLALLLVGGSVVASVMGYIKLPYVNSTLIKPDPKATLLSGASLLAQASSYKTDTDVTLTSPLFSDISAGLLSGDVINSQNKESLSVHVAGTTNNDSASSPSYEYMATVKGSILKDDIITRVVHSDTTSFVSIPDLSHFLGTNFPQPTTVAVKDGEFTLLLPVVKETIVDLIHKYDTYNILSEGMPPFVSGELTKSTQEFIGGLAFISKEDQVVSGVPMYHYEGEASNQVTKTLFSEISDLLFASLPPTDKSRLSDALGSIHVDSVDVWIAKDGPHVYQYKISMTMPLSKFLGLEDKSLSGSVIRLDWQTRLYDIGVANTITVPSLSVPMADYVKSITDMKIKNAAQALPPTAQAFHNATLNFGKASNLSGSCSKPTTSSLFSPTGHSKGASIAVGDMATIVNTVIKLTGEGASCYSTPSSWAIALPLASDPEKYYCVDSKGTAVNLSTKISGPVCK